MKRFFEFVKDLVTWGLSLSTVLVYTLFGVGTLVIGSVIPVVFYVMGIFALLLIVPAALIIVLFVLIVQPHGNSGKLEGEEDEKSC